MSISAMFHMRNMPRLRCTMIEWMNAVNASHGISATFSIGSQLQYPPQPSMVYAHHAPSSIPMPSSAHITIANTRARSTQSSLYFPEMSAPVENANGMIIPISPDMINGGCE